MSQATTTGAVPTRLRHATVTLDGFIRATVSRDRQLLYAQYVDAVKGQAVLARARMAKLLGCVQAGIPLDMEIVRNWQESAHKAQTSISALESPDPNLQDDLRAVADEAKAMLDSAKQLWRSMVGEATVPVRSYLEMAERLQDQSATLNARQKLLLMQRLEAAEPSRNARELMEDAVASASQGLRTLIGDNPEVKEFVRAACSGGAPLDELSDAVKAWLESRGMKEKFRIVYGAVE